MVAKPWLETKLACLLFPQLPSPPCESETLGVELSELYFNTSHPNPPGPGDSRTAALADLAPSWLTTGKSTNIWIELVHSLPLLSLIILSAGPGQRARCSRSLVFLVVRNNPTLREDIPASRFQERISQGWFLDTGGTLALSITWGTFTNHQCLAPSPDQACIAGGGVRS